MIGQFEFAQLLYGKSRYRVHPNQHAPLPDRFDFEKPEECARRCFAIMSNASGGHVLKNCKAQYNLERGTANLTSSGAHIYFKDPDAPKLDIEALVDMHLASTIINLGTVVTDQYGMGWSRAQWSEEQNA